MILTELVSKYDNGMTVLVINDNNLNCIFKGKVIDFLHDGSRLNFCKVVAFGFYDNELCVRIQV